MILMAKLSFVACILVVLQRAISIAIKYKNSYIEMMLRSCHTPVIQRRCEAST
jgi:hypothetical protein